MTEVNVRENAMHFEGVKVSMSQDKNGIILRLSVHPNDCPKELHTDWVGTRYMVAMVRLNDQDEPETRLEQQRIERLISSAGLLCRNEEFAEFLVMIGFIHDLNIDDIEKSCANALREHCGIVSRSEFRDNVTAREKFEQLREEFRLWKKK